VRIIGFFCAPNVVRFPLVVLGRNSIIWADALTKFTAIPDSSIPLIIADMPYYNIIGDDWDNQWEDLDGYLSWADVLFRNFARVLMEGGACYVYSSITHYPHVQLCLNRHLEYAFTITWKKQRSRGNGWGFNREEICVNVKGNHIFKPVETSTLMLPHLRKGKIDYSGGKRRVRLRDYKLATAIWDDIPQVCSYRKQLHPTEKPVENARRMLEASSEKGDLVLVPFVGSGSEVEACIRLGRSFIGFEASSYYCRIARERIAQVQSVAKEPGSSHGL
jgi:adenine-specific DNA-methyltransferase